jgi:hypothetical protein
MRRGFQPEAARGGGESPARCEIKEDAGAEDSEVAVSMTIPARAIPAGSIGCYKWRLTRSAKSPFVCPATGLPAGDSRS